jgi:transcriptional regulator with XRE-family HTH domain
MKDEPNHDVFILTNVSIGQQAKLTRIAQGLRQIDVASKAGVTVQEVIRLEKDSYVLPTRLQKILAALGIDNGNESD